MLSACSTVDILADRTYRTLSVKTSCLQQWVVDLIGPEQASACARLPRVARRLRMNSWRGYAFTSIRATSRISKKLLVSQCDHRVDTHCPPTVDITGRKCHTCEYQFAEEAGNFIIPRYPTFHLLINGNPGKIFLAAHIAVGFLTRRRRLVDSNLIGFRFTVSLRLLAAQRNHHLGERQKRADQLLNDKHERVYPV